MAMIAGFAGVGDTVGSHLGAVQVIESLTNPVSSVGA
jgi:hypothetical protein